MFNVVSWTPGRIAIVRYEGKKRITVRVLPDTERNLDAARDWCGKQNARLLAERGRGAARG